MKNMERFIIVTDRNKHRTIRVNLNSIMCYYPAYDERGFETIEYTVLQLTGNERMCKLDISGLSSELDQYFVLINHTTDVGELLETNLIPEDYRMD